jgi:C4-type Zn-finger protein
MTDREVLSYVCGYLNRIIDVMPTGEPSQILLSIEDLKKLNNIVAEQVDGKTK